MSALTSAWALAKLDLLIWRRMPQAILTALIPPIGMALLLVVLSYNATQQPVALVVQDRGPAAQKMQSLIAQDTETYALKTVDSEEAAQLIASQQVAGVITIPPDFDSSVAIHNGRLLLTLNNVDIDFSDDIRRSVARSVAQFDAPQLGLDAELDPNDKYISHGNPYHIDVDEDDLRQTNVDFIHYQVMPVLVLLILSVGLIGVALACAADRQRGTARLLCLAPASAWALVAGRLLSGVLASLIVLIPAILLCVILRIITPPPGHWPALCAIFLATALAASAMGAVLGATLKGTRDIAMASSLLATYLFFLGGGFTTIAFLPAWIRSISAFNPFRYAIDGLRQALFYPELTGLTTDITILSITAAICLFLGSLSLRHSWAQS